MAFLVLLDNNKPQNNCNPTKTAIVHFNTISPMINKQNLLHFLLFASISTFSFSQTYSHKIDVNKDIDIVRVYEQVVVEGYGTPFIYKKLATAYYFKSEYEKALPWFQKLFAEEKSTDPELVKQYQQSLKAVTVANSNIPKEISYLE